MSKKLFALVLAVVFVASCAGNTAFAAEQTAATKKAVVATSAPKAPVAATTAQKALPTRPAAHKPNFGMIAGTISAIDTADPANVKIEVKNDTDGSVRTVSVTPWTNITKVTDISELKVGERVRMRTRKLEDKDVAMGIMFGKIKAMPAPAPKAPVPPPSAAPAKIKK